MPAILCDSNTAYLVVSKFKSKVLRSRLQNQSVTLMKVDERIVDDIMNKTNQYNKSKVKVTDNRLYLL